MSAAPTPRPPTPLIQRFVRYGVGFGVGVGLGFGPFLGTIGVPGFKALIELFPEVPDLKNTLIPTSAFLMGLVAVAVQFFSGDRPSRRALRRWFVAALGALLVGFVILVELSGRFVVAVPVHGGDEARVMISWRVEEGCCDDPEGRPLGPQECILEKTTLDRARIERCWGADRLSSVGRMLTFSYLAVTSGFGVLVGLVLLAEQDLRRKGARKAKRSGRQRSP